MDPKYARPDMKIFDSILGLPKGIWDQCHEASGSTRDREFLEYVGCYCLLLTEEDVAEFLNKVT